MWVLNFLPSWSIHTIFISGVVLLTIGKTISFIPFVSTYRSIITLVGAVLFTWGVWLEGGNHYIEKARAEVARIEKESKEATAKIEQEYQTKLVLTKQKGETIVKYVDKYITKEADAKCVIPNNVVVLHDSAAHNKVPDAARLANESASGVTLSTTTKTVTENYGTYHELKEQLISLQRWVKEQQKIRE